MKFLVSRKTFTKSRFFSEKPRFSEAFFRVLQDFNVFLVESSVCNPFCIFARLDSVCYVIDLKWAHQEKISKKDPPKNIEKWQKNGKKHQFFFENSEKTSLNRGSKVSKSSLNLQFLLHKNSVSRENFTKSRFFTKSTVTRSGLCFISKMLSFSKSIFRQNMVSVNLVHCCLYLIPLRISGFQMT